MDGQARKDWRHSLLCNKCDSHIHRCFYDHKTKLMPIKFNKEGFTIEVKTGTNPIESWIETHDEFLDALQSEEEEMHIIRPHYLELLRSMMPDPDTAKKMLTGV